jgi:periplasmic copper chaperone A
MVFPIPRQLAKAVAGFLILLAFIPTGQAHDYEAKTIHIGHPWVRATPQGAKVAGGYLTLKNNGNEPDRLIGVNSSIAPNTAIHEMAVDKQGVMTMRPLPDGVEIAPGAQVDFKPGGLHLMFTGLSQQLKEGERIKGTLTFEKAGTVDVEFEIEPMGGVGGHGSSHEGHGG